MEIWKSSFQVHIRGTKRKDTSDITQNLCSFLKGVWEEVMASLLFLPEDSYQLPANASKALMHYWS